MQRRRPGIAKAGALPPQLAEDSNLATVVHTALADIDALISRRAERRASAFTWGTPERGGARLLRAPGCAKASSLQIRWKHNEIESIELEPRSETAFRGLVLPADPSELLDRLVPMVWRYIRRGGALGPGVDRFADWL